MERGCTIVFELNIPQVCQSSSEFVRIFLHLKSYKFSKTVKNVLYHTKDSCGLIILRILTRAYAASFFDLKNQPIHIKTIPISESAFKIKVMLPMGTFLDFADVSS